MFSIFWEDEPNSLRLSAVLLQRKNLHSSLETPKKTKTDHLIINQYRISSLCLQQHREAIFVSLPRAPLALSWTAVYLMAKIKIQLLTNEKHYFDDWGWRVCMILSIDFCTWKSKWVWYFLMMNKRGLTLICGIIIFFPVREMPSVAPYRFLRLLHLAVDPKKTKNKQTD